MELDDFKIAIRKNPVSFYQHRSVDAIQTVIQRKSTSIVRKIKRNLLFEFAFSLLFMAIVIYIIATSRNLYLEFFGYAMLCYSAYFSYYTIRLYKKMSGNSVEFTVKVHLQHLVSILKRFIDIYFQVTMIFLPLSFVAGIIIVLLTRMSSTANFSFNFSLKLVILYCALFIGWSVIMYFLTQWYIKKWYGDHLNNLKRALRELEINE